MIDPEAGNEETDEAGIVPSVASEAQTVLTGETSVLLEEEISVNRKDGKGAEMGLNDRTSTSEDLQDRILFNLNLIYRNEEETTATRSTHRSETNQR